MSNLDRLKIVLDAINDIKSRIKAAQLAGDELAVHKLSGDLIALEACLVTEAELLVKAA